MKGARAALALAASSAVWACGAPSAPKAPVEQAFHVEPLTDLVALPRLTWLLHARPRALYAVPSLAAALEELIGSERLAAFTRAHGGLDPRALHEVVYARVDAGAGHPDGELSIGRGYLPAARIERAELAALPYVRQHAREPSGLVHIEGRMGNQAIDWLLFGHQAVARAEGAPLAAKTARAFAERRLKKVHPALASGPLAEVERALGPADLRVFGARPDRSFARDGLLEHFEAVGLSVVPVEQSGALFLTLRIAAVGSFGDREQVVEEQLRARLARIDASRVGALLGLRAAAPWTLRADARVVIAERRVPGAEFLHGLHLATGADTAELFAAP